MDREAYVNQTIDTGIELALELREGKISREHYPTFIRALKEYRELIRGERLIERELASILYYLDIAFMSAFDSPHFNIDDRELLKRVHQDFVPIMMGIFNPKADLIEE